MSDPEVFDAFVGIDKDDALSVCIVLAVYIRTWTLHFFHVGFISDVCFS